ncbi:hypothetical protein GQ53DRAFT_765947 [Thozetella sp. PMI_491]|nr:hypothetical protein GQ53DRAFT_765947 [Thozetella sp. PMI_491]
MADSDATTPPPKPPTFSWLYTCNATLGTPINVGPGPKGQRTVIPITGGTFAGPKLSGKILSMGADWALMDSNRTFAPDTRYQLETSDGAHIFIQTNGVAQEDKKCHLRVVFETGSHEYYWLNNIVAVGILYPAQDMKSVKIEVWQIGSPEPHL